MKKSLSKHVTKFMLGLTLASSIGAISVSQVSHQVLHEKSIVRAASYRTWEYRTIRQGAGYIRQRRSVVKGWYRGVGWVYSSVGAWHSY